MARGIIGMSDELAEHLTGILWLHCQRQLNFDPWRPPSPARPRHPGAPDRGPSGALLLGQSSGTALRPLMP